MKKTFFAAMLFISVAAASQGMQADTSDGKNKDLETEFDRTVVPDTYKSKFNPYTSDSDSISQTNLKMNEEVFRYTFNQNKKVFQWQYISSIIIFFVVVFIVLMGLYLAYIQFRLSEKMFLKQSTDKSKDDANALELIKADLELGKDGLKINTAVIGLIILSLSLAFLFLYLKYVYPISIVKIQ